MCSNFLEINNHIENINNFLDYIHIDIMDGHFVDNYGLSLDFCNKLKECTTLPFDYHLMVEEPHKIIPKLKLSNNDIVSIHYESIYHIQKVISLLKDYKSKIFIALKPKTPFTILEPILKHIDGINFLTVNPGFAGQKMLDVSIEKCKKLIAYLNAKKAYHLEIEVDGNMSIENIKLFKDLGANIFVLGTSSIFGQKDMQDSIKTMMIELSKNTR